MLSQSAAQPSRGQQLHDRIAALVPYHRSITGEGVRQTLRDLREIVPLTIHEVPSGTRVFDWTVPREWAIRDAYIKDTDGRRIVDYRESPLHVVNSSVPVHARMSLNDLRPNIHTRPDQPDVIPYRYAHYQAGWGFCMRHRDFEAMPEGMYEVRIDSAFTDGSLTYGECCIPGASEREVLFSCHVCHPALANDNLSGIAVAAELARTLMNRDLRYTYRFVFVPSTIGAITWLARNEHRTARIDHGLVLSNLGDPGGLTYKVTRNGGTDIDRAMRHLFGYGDRPGTVRPFSPYGYDERQYNSPGFQLPVGLLTRTPHEGYPEYHTSADDLNLLTPEALEDSYDFIMEVVNLVETNRTYLNTCPKGEPELGRRGLYRSVAGHSAGRTAELPHLWVLNLADGAHNLLHIAERAGLAYSLVEQAASRLVEVGLLREAVGAPPDGAAPDRGMPP
ncbi:aminopeptidase-like domain-containing protein [Limimonas halophila]|uniref:Aminopeptidase-like domain-containing protein n=1 Tax=Limimonas halophila TaxID=1082479 RepID=A0A1G7Q9G9_9PROT|nr:DUF4910 domain-containing protein [Limimonas halophila]SDF94230.1 aminopeptidase-like domain-containing protein [Limimonas halophila]